MRATGRATDGHGTSDVKNVGPDYNHGKAKPFSAKESERAKTPPVKGPAKVGETKLWLADDDINGIYLKNYTLRGIGDHIEVWVADDTAFPQGDCRNALGLADITDQQVHSFIHEFDTNIYPKESEAFSVAPNRNGSKATLDDILSDKTNSKKKGESKLPSDYWVGDGDNTVVLVDNVRDANFYHPSSPDGQTYIAGFFYSVFNEYLDRNIMTIDAYDWLHRTGANPPDNSQDADYQACESASGKPRPHMYEGTFAHEYQHLLEYYQDPDEVSWVNEGLSDYAQSLVGYVDTSVPVTDPAADSHIACFSGYLAAQGYGGPENSLTRWGDQGGPEILCDYGAAYSFMQYLYGHYGSAFLSALHQEPGNGLAGLQNVLDASGSPDSAQDVVHRWAATMALDNVVDNGATLTGGDPATYSEDSLGSQINWDATYGDSNHDGTADDPGNEAYSTPGAAPNGSDYVRLGSADATDRSYLGAGDLTSVAFDGSGSRPASKVAWQVDATPPASTTAGTTCGTTTPQGVSTVDDAAFYSGCGANLDRSVSRSVTVPAADPTLTFRSLWDTEQGWDFGFVQVYDAAQQKFVSVGCTDTAATADPGAVAAVKDNLPGFTGDSAGWKDESCDLSAYAGQDVELAFRYVTDPGVNEAGWWVDDVAVGGTAVADGSSLAGWRTETQAHPVPVAGYTVQLVAYTDDGQAAWVGRLPVARGTDGDFHGALTGAALRAVVGDSAQTVAALVMQDDPAETSGEYARYTLTANGVTQPGG